MSQALDAGARGYILKNALDLDLASAVKRVAAGETVLDPTVTPAAALKGERNHGLSARELEVLQLICQGHSNRAIAARLNLSVNTVSVHRANIMGTAAASTRPPSSSSMRCDTGWSDRCEPSRVHRQRCGIGRR